MAKRSPKELTELILYCIRPALAEAHLISVKQASDLVYATTLAEELHGIEKKLTALESELHLDVAGETQTLCGERPSADWIRSKSAALELRLRRIEESPEEERREGYTRMASRGQIRITTESYPGRPARSDTLPMAR